MTKEIEKRTEEWVEKTTKEVLDKKNFYTHQTSYLVRYANGALLGVAWTLLTSQEFGSAMSESIWSIVHVKAALVWGMAFVVLALVFDFLQYWAGAKSQKRVLGELESGALTAGPLYDPSDCWYIAQHRFFVRKILISVINLVLYAVVFAHILF